MWKEPSFILDMITESQLGQNDVINNMTFLAWKNDGGI